MGICLSLLGIPLVNKLIKLHSEINGRWVSFLYTLGYLLRRRQRIKTNRIMIHDVWKDSIRDAGILPFPHEWEYDSPNQNKNEDLLIYGVNSSKQSIKIDIKWRVNNVFNHNNQSIERNSSISLRFDDNDGNYYTLDEESKVTPKHKEYRISGLTVEILSPFKRKRISFRGFLTKNGRQLVYVRFRFVWAAISRVYDFTHDFDDYLMAKEWTQCSRSQFSGIFENRFEQFGQIKGTFTEDNIYERTVYFWGSISKRYSEPINRRIIRIIGYNKRGIGFDLGIVLNDGFEYRFGFLFDKNGNFKNLKTISLRRPDFEDLLKISPNISFKALFGEKEYEFEIKEIKNNLANYLIVDGNPGMCYIFEENYNEFQERVETIEKHPKDVSLVLSLNEENAKSVDLSGGKGSSLAVLMALNQKLDKENYENKFKVPNGVVVTANAYQRLLGEYEDIQREIKDLEESVDVSKEELKTKCKKLVDFITKHKIPQIIANEIKKKLKQNFNDFENKLFAVRSSGALEDSEEMSSAGLMTTYLGVKGLENIEQSVMKCWSSQFSFITVEYKRSYGQIINTPMAVVIQEMVGCESAGVMFTCDPISGDERVIEITANYGLGESVVSASSEPDIITLSVNIESNSLSKVRTIRGLESKVIGTKKTMIKLLEYGGTIEEEVVKKEKGCISDDHLIRLADIGLKIHRHYGNPRDIEWGLKEGHLFMLQSRPVTNLDTLSDYEIMHEMDTGHPTEFEIYSRAHWAENFPGSSSWTVYTWTWANKSGLFRIGLQNGSATEDDYNPYTFGMGIHYNQLMFNMGNGFFGTFSGYPETNEAKQAVLSLFGHHIEDKDVLNLLKETKKSKKKISILRTIQNIFGLFYGLIFGPKNMIKAKTEYMDELKYNMVERIGNKKMSKDVLIGICGEYPKVYMAQHINHGTCTFGALVKNMLLRVALEGAQKDDFNLMISSCDDVISAEVPNALRDIVKSIQDQKKFIKLNDQDALKTLKYGTDEAAKKFKSFLLKHGHRGYRECDPMYLPWADDPIPCIKTIKGMLSANEPLLVCKVSKSMDQVINELKTPLSLFRKLLIRKLLLPWSRSGVRYRELSKYFWIWMYNQQRQAFILLANRMVKEGLISNTETFFYLTIEEIERLCNGERDPMIHTRARIRKKVYPKMDKYKFEEFIKGPEMKPTNFENKIITTNLTDGSVGMSGTPVSIGTVKARVCVAEDITDTDSIESGDILITYSTDIGWSPYFPLLSGIVTEIGGTISHGRSSLVNMGFLVWWQWRAPVVPSKRGISVFWTQNPV